jgi:hypothetical protein
VNQALEQALGSGFILAEIEKTELNEEAGAALVHPRAVRSDEIFFLRGCRFPVILRRHYSTSLYFEVVGGAWLDVNSARLKRYHNWAIGKGELSRSDRRQTLRLM